jgi:hypothetical protein
MADLTGTDFSRNYEKAQPSSLFGTRELAYLQISLPVSVEYPETGEYTDSGSLYEQVVKALQQRVEIFAVGAPDDYWFVVIAAATTVPFNIDPVTKQQNQHNQDRERITALEDIIMEVTGLSDVKVWNGQLKRASIENND